MATVATKVVWLAFISVSAVSDAFVLPKSSLKFQRVGDLCCRRRMSPHTRRPSLLCLRMSTDDTTKPSQMVVYNSLTRQKDVFCPSEDSMVKMYTCGPTVYDYAHVGNFRAFLTYDVLKRVLRYLGYSVKHVCNLTDVDDKIIARCNREGVGLATLTDRYATLFQNDLEALNIVPADIYPRATQHIDDMVELIQILHTKGLAYQSEEGSWYFQVSQKEGYGQQLVNLDVSSMKRGASGMAGLARGGANDEVALDADEYDAEKVGVRDFALWKAPKADFDREDAIWDTPIGKGRPGWHLECSAMARRYFGDDTIDFHCGGIDLKFPHHENEIAQSEGATGNRFCNCWLHNGFVNVGDEKMSKSKGNFLTLRGACPKADDVRAYRYLVVSSQYRNPLSFTKAAMGAAKGALKRLDRIRQQLDNALEGDSPNNEENETEIVQTVQKELTNFEAAIRDDLSTPRAAAALFGVVKAAETEFKRVKKAQEEAEKNDSDSTNGAVVPLDLVGLRAVRDAIIRMDTVFGIFYEVPSNKTDDDDDNRDKDGESKQDDSVPGEVLELVAARSAAKEAKDWALADSLRDQIQELGFVVKDVKGGEPIVNRM